MLADCTELVKMLKQTALDAVDAKKPAAVYYGTVLSAAPLKIDVEQKMTSILRSNMRPRTRKAAQARKPMKSTNMSTRGERKS